MSSKALTFSLVLSGLLAALAIGHTLPACAEASDTSDVPGADSAAPAPAAIAARMNVRRLT